MRPKTFIEALNCFSTGTKKSKSFLTDKRLLQTERNILKCYFLLRDNKLNDVDKILRGMSTESSSVVESQKSLLWGLVLMSRSNYLEAMYAFRESLMLMNGEDLAYFEMIALVNLFFSSFNLRDVKTMEEALQRLNAHNCRRPIEKLRVLQCKFNYYSFIKDFEVAKKILMEIDKMRDLLPEADNINHLTCKLDFYLRLDELELALQTVEMMKDHRKFHLSQSFRYIRILLDHYLFHGPLYFADDDFKDHFVPFHELKVIQKLEEGDSAGALVFWLELQKTNPVLYDGEFDYQDDKNLFGRCLSKYKATLKAKMDIQNSSENILKTLYRVFRDSTSPIRKELLFEMLWGRPPESKEDMLRLAKNVSKVRTTYHLDIKSRKGSYYLEKNFVKNKIS